MSGPTTGPVKASAVIPSLFRFLLINIEPLFAFNGALLCLIKPEKYLTTMTRGHLTSLNTNSLGSPLTPTITDQFIYTQLLGGWLFFAFTEAIILRLVDHISVWKLLCMGMLLSDLAYVHSCAQAVGGWSEWVVVSHWRLEDWIVTVTTWPFVLTRLAIVLGIGQKEVTRDVVKKTS